VEKYRPLPDRMKAHALRLQPSAATTARPGFDPAALLYSPGFIATRRTRHLKTAGVCRHCNPCNRPFPLGSLSAPLRMLAANPASPPIARVPGSSDSEARYVGMFPRKAMRLARCAISQFDLSGEARRSADCRVLDLARVPVVVDCDDRVGSRTLDSFDLARIDYMDVDLAKTGWHHVLDHDKQMHSPARHDEKRISPQGPYANGPQVSQPNWRFPRTARLGRPRRSRHVGTACSQFHSGSRMYAPRLPRRNAAPSPTQ
jgi:hypothetical protein